MSLVPPDPELNPIESALGRLAPVAKPDRSRPADVPGRREFRRAQSSASLGLAGDRGLAGGRGPVGVGCPGGPARARRCRRPAAGALA